MDLSSEKDEKIGYGLFILQSGGCETFLKIFPFYIFFSEQKNLTFLLWQKVFFFCKKEVQKYARIFPRRIKKHLKIDGMFSLIHGLFGKTRVEKGCCWTMDMLVGCYPKSRIKKKSHYVVHPLKQGC